MTITPESIAAALAIGWGGFERFRSMRANKKTEIAREQATTATAQQTANEELIRAKDRVAETVRAEADAWKLRYETEHNEFVESRKENHERVQKINAQLIELAASNSELQAKTDLSPLAEFAKNQVETNQKVVVMTGQIVETQHKIIELLQQLNGHPHDK